MGKMGVDVAKDRYGVTVHAVTFVHRRGPVFYASLPHDIASPLGQGADGGVKHRLVSILWDHLTAMESSPGKRCRSSTAAGAPGFAGGSAFAAKARPLTGDAFPIQVVHDPLGKPHLLLGEHRGPAVSFCEGGGKVWAALCGDESDIGIDAAGSDEFQSEYPFHRVFHTQELQHASMLAGGDVANASALLWSIKEAVVKALGCGFHLVDPREICVHPSIEGSGGHAFAVYLSRKTLVRIPKSAGRSIGVRSFPGANMWLSIALLN